MAEPPPTLVDSRLAGRIPPGRGAATDVPVLAVLLEALGVDAINVQLRFDEEHDRELARLAEGLAPITAALGPAAAALFPPRLQVATHEVETRVRVVVERTRRAEVKLVPLNLGYDLRYGTTATRESRLRVRVALTPPRRAPLGSPGREGGDGHGTPGEQAGQ